MTDTITIERLMMEIEQLKAEARRAIDAGEIIIKTLQDEKAALAAELAVARSKNNLQGAEGTPLFGDVA